MISVNTSLMDMQPPTTSSDGHCGQIALSWCPFTFGKKANGYEGKQLLFTDDRTCSDIFLERIFNSFFFFFVPFSEMEVDASIILCRCLQAKRYSPWSMASKFLYFPKLSSGSLLALKLTVAASNLFTKKTNLPQWNKKCISPQN